MRHNQLAGSELISSKYPMIAAAAPQIADPLVRNLGTIGGSLTHCDPSGDLGAVMLAARTLAWCCGARTASARCAITEFLADTFQSSIEPNELLTKIRVTSPTGSYGGTYLKLERKIGDYATVAVATQAVDVRTARSAPPASGSRASGSRTSRRPPPRTPSPDRRRARSCSPRRAGSPPRPSSPVSDVRGCEAYKRHMVEVYVRRGLTRSAEMAGAA